jgi:hypothetical protein
LDQFIQSGSPIDSIFIAGNPTIVFALISTDADPHTEPFTSEIKTAETALANALGVPVELQILTTETRVGEAAESSNAAFAEIIEQTLNENLQNSKLVDFSFEVGNPFIIEIAISTELDPTSEDLISDIETAEEALSAALDITVLLDVTVP